MINCTKISSHSTFVLRASFVLESSIAYRNLEWSEGFPCVPN
jgi:hypothetical protein